MTPNFIFPLGRPGIVCVADDDDDQAPNVAERAVQGQEPQEEAITTQAVEEESAIGQVTEESSEDNASEGDYVIDWAHYRDDEDDDEYSSSVVQL